MKHMRFSIAALALMCSASFVVNAQEKVTQQPKTISVTDAGPESKATVSSDSIIGVWHSTDHTDTLLPGLMTFDVFGRVTLAPDGFEPVKGIFKVDKYFIDIEINGKGHAMLAYSFSKGALSIQYEDGSKQRFFRDTKKAPKKSSKSAKKDAK